MQRYPHHLIFDDMITEPRMEAYSPVSGSSAPQRRQPTGRRLKAPRKTLGGVRLLAWYVPFPSSAPVTQTPQKRLIHLHVRAVRAGSCSS